MKKTRYLKVYYLFQGTKELPYIRLTGQWLKELNFSYGDPIKLTLKKKRIVIDRMPKPKKKK
ncbi:SymE family type I addiction module toxin [Tenacibaculum maritimum]|uniref:SymE family type I addiction module toxin n=1 Tax=Tenacibaculum maritimum TaxID=107401 RepID=UPI0013309106|nr:SymE family type I addiction module toxin [Tenacibaculum maritimum]MCD9567160.1 type I toxin-antitoxin system SymE family toxin [Tenacibaculum maritimum]MCD9583018.1 type I toxin-antitoxin system SymE family toxin [Tenacibaculum maritimum]MCD9585880.1 type I toxin-antitoxin system SymE family toxin [Tenacibaculum maritimum]MCD9612240.1 type I toxin-antitoxin system SymE family toxin [Tenacibaculum maritimum]MCD9622004.1 type I toxin-antitoxin system SymE family toxin [Tenacibaculum maritimu